MHSAPIFDMDGLLIDSEPLWKIAERRVFARVGIQISLEMSETMVGLRIRWSGVRTSPGAPFCFLPL
jgi:sugar-phosphatase